MPFHPQVVARMLEDVFERYLVGEDPHDIEALVAARLLRRLYAASGPLADGRAERAGDGLLGHHRQGSRSAGVQAPRRARARATAFLHLYLCAAGRSDAMSTRTRTWLPSALRSTWPRASRRSSSIRSGRILPSMAGSFRSRRSSCCERFVRELREAVGTKADLLFGTHGQMTAAGAIRLARRLEPYDPLWFEEPVPPDAPEEMATRGARDLASRSPPASGSPPSTISRGCCAPAPRRSCR